MKLAALLILCTLGAEAATTGRGNFPVNSRWVKVNGIRKKVVWASSNQDLKTTLEDWFFDPAPPPPPSGVITRTLMRVGR